MEESCSWNGFIMESFICRQLRASRVVLGKSRLSQSLTEAKGSFFFLNFSLDFH